MRKVGGGGLYMQVRLRQEQCCCQLVKQWMEASRRSGPVSATCGQQCRRQNAPVGWLSCKRRLRPATARHGFSRQMSLNSESCLPNLQSLFSLPEPGQLVVVFAKNSRFNAVKSQRFLPQLRKPGFQSRRQEPSPGHGNGRQRRLHRQTAKRTSRWHSPSAVIGPPGQKCIVHSLTATFKSVGNGPPTTKFQTSTRLKTQPRVFHDGLAREPR